MSVPPGLVVLTDGEDRAEWLAIRRGVRTATAAAAIAGTHPYYRMVDVWNEQTDPQWTPAEARTKWTADRIDLGVEREPHIIEWANADHRTGGGLQSCGALVRAADVPEGHASTPDGWKIARDGGLVLIECKTAGKDWETTGIPDHVYDQVQWQLYTTRAVRCWLAVEVYDWQGRGPNKTPVLAKTWLVSIAPDERRLQFLLAKVEAFEADMRDGISPESDVDLTAPAVIDWDDDEDTIAQKMADEDERRAVAAGLAALARLQAEVVPTLTAMAMIEAEVKASIKTYHGRRVHLTGGQLVPKLVRYTRKTLNTKDQTEQWTRDHTEWAESERVVIETPTPDTKEA